MLLVLFMIRILMMLMMLLTGIRVCGNSHPVLKPVCRVLMKKVRLHNLITIGAVEYMSSRWRYRWN
ncbi:hypothetical protein D3C79_1108530 [compost metagenome]